METNKEKNNANDKFKAIMLMLKMSNSIIKLANDKNWQMGNWDSSRV